MMHANSDCPVLPLPICEQRYTRTMIQKYRIPPASPLFWHFFAILFKFHRGYPEVVLGEGGELLVIVVSVIRRVVFVGVLVVKVVVRISYEIRSFWGIHQRPFVRKPGNSTARPRMKKEKEKERRRKREER